MDDDKTIPARPIPLPKGAYARNRNGVWHWRVEWGDEDNLAARHGTARSEHQAICDGTAAALGMMMEAEIA